MGAVKKETESPKPETSGDCGERKREFARKQDEFLDIYSLYLKTGLAWVKEEALRKAFELHLLDKNFQVEI